MSIASKITQYEKQIITSYENYSILPHVCKLQKVSAKYEIGKFSKFANKMKIDPEILFHEPGIVNMGSLGIDIAHSETKEVLDNIVKKSPPKKINADVSRELLTDAVKNQKDKGFDPQFMFVPIDYFMDMWNWSLEGFGRANFDGQGGYYWTIDNRIKLKIKYSNKRTPFDNFIISDKKYNVWEYRSDQKTGGRLTANFDMESDPNNPYLLIQTIFKFTVTEPRANLVLKFKKKKQ